VVTVHRQAVSLRATTLGLLLCTASACSSFNPVEPSRFTLLNEQTYEGFGLAAHWVAYDDQHSRFSACTNGAAGNHQARECSHLDRPFFDWDGGKCPPSAQDLDQGRRLVSSSNGICIQGELSAYLPCSHGPAQCLNAVRNTDMQDASNMWGAGVGLTFSEEGVQPWNPHDHGVRGVAFDLTLFPEDTKLGGSELNLRVQVPSILSEKDAEVTFARPLMMDDGSVLDTNGDVHDCESNDITESHKQLTLANVSHGPITSDLHPYGSSFWQLPPGEKGPMWGPSPVQAGHNEFSWKDVAPPPEAYSNYSFDETKILGVHFQVAHPQDSKAAYPFAFCVNNLAFLME